MWTHLSIALLLQAAPTIEPPIAPTRTVASTNEVAKAKAPGSVLEAANNAVIGFIGTWRSAWHANALFSRYGDDVRLRDVHCHWDGSFKGSSGRPYPPSVIHHGSRRSMCPNWYPTEEGEKPDERVDRDGSLNPMLRDRVHQARATLIDSLAALTEHAPNDPWITGQRVRFLVDQGSVKEAVEVARRCSAGTVWCAQLLGFALNAAGDFRASDAAYDAATAAMSPKDQCIWTSTELILDEDGRNAYGRMNCEERLAANKKIWWMSTPLFSDSSADRRSEDFTRKVLIQLHSALNWDERFDWRKRYGGEAVSEMLNRYGWPAFSMYGGDYHERDHASWLTFYDSTRTATTEYPQDRVHLVPVWTAVTDPFKAPGSAWQLNMPELRGNDEIVVQWWPAEHYAPNRGNIAQLREQSVMLRRDDDIELATASELHFGTKAIKADTAAAVLMRSPSPDSIQRLKRRVSQNASALVLRARIPSAPAVVGTEVLAPRGGLSLRTRFGITPPTPLSTLKSDEKAISEPVLIASDGRPSGPDDALSRMLGSTAVRTRKIAVYWETYGYAAGDSIDVALIITRTEKLSAFRRIGMKLRLAHDINGSVALRWSEPQLGRDSWMIPGKVPIQARAVGLDLAELEPGNYTVTVSAARKGAVGPMVDGKPTPGPSVTASRSFVIVR